MQGFPVCTYRQHINIKKMQGFPVCTYRHVRTIKKHAKVFHMYFCSAGAELETQDTSNYAVWLEF